MSECQPSTYPISAERATTVEDLQALLSQTALELETSRKAVETAQQAHDRDREKLRKLEHMLLMAEKNKAGKSRSVIVSGSLAASGVTAVITMTPVCFLQLLGVISHGAFGYALAVLFLGATLTLLATVPTASRLIRFIGALYAYVALSFFIVFASMGALEITEVYCGEFDEGVCELVAIGKFVCLVGLFCASAGWAWTLRLIPGSERVPLSQLRAWATPKMGCFFATVATFTGAPTVWAVAQPDESFVLSPRKSLHRLWLVWRLGNCWWGATWTVVVVVACSRGHAGAPVVTSLMPLAVVQWLIALLATEKNRGRVHNRLGRLGSSEETRAAALLAAVVGGMDPQSAFDSAKQAFSGIRFDALTVDDFGRGDLAGKEARDLSLRARTTQGLKLGDVDAFLSHSWRDDHIAKWAALSAWAANFSQRKGGASPMLWLDKACIDQQNISASLACLPVFLAGCKQLLIVPGPTYVHRLWYVPCPSAHKSPSRLASLFPPLASVASPQVRHGGLHFHLHGWRRPPHHCPANSRPRRRRRAGKRRRSRGDPTAPQRR